MLVPDAIQPVEGWKALALWDNGSLWSPQVAFRWPEQQRAEAKCQVVRNEWVVKPGRPPEQRDPQQIIVRPTLTPVTTPGPMLTTAAEDDEEATEPGAPPLTELPDGLHWSWERVRHDPASRPDCRCGLYIVDTPEQCRHYLSNDTVLVHLYGWGNVIRGNKGARVQYAYPKEIVATERFRDAAELAAELYKVPVQIVPDSRRPATTQQWETLNQALNKLTDAQKQAAAQLQTLTPNATPPQNVPPVTPFVKAAGVALGASIVATSNYFGMARGDSLAKGAMIFCIALTGLLLFIDYLIFAAEEKART